MKKNVDALSKLLGIELFVFPFENCDASSLEAMGKTIISKKSPSRSGKSAQRMLSYWAGRAAVAIAFKRLGIQAFVQPNFDYGYLEVVDESGESIPDIFINLSHTENIAAVVLSNKPVGVDVELADRDASRVVSRVASDSERQLAKLGVFATNGKAINPDIALWSAKEAAAKAVGLGMKFGLNCFEIQFSKNDIYRVKTDKIGPLELKSPTLVIESFDPYIVSVCSESESMPSGRIGRSLISTLDFF